MSQLMKIESNGLLPMQPRHEFVIRPATLDDFAWIDAMQKAESDKLGFLMQAAIEKRIEQGNVLVAEETTVNSEQSTVNSKFGDSPACPVDCSQGTVHSPQALGYCIAVDRYMKQDHVGQFVQLNVKPGIRRGLVGAALVQATFDKAAYGVRLYGLWCRQDLAANRFWEAMGFVPLAFRAAGVNGKKGPRDRGAKGPSERQKTPGASHLAPGPLDPSPPSARIHIYWQKRIRVGDTQTSYWFPYETSGGLMAESRVVLPISPETDWQDVMPVVLPGAERRAEEARLLEAEGQAKADEAKAALAAKRKEAREAAKRAKQVVQGPRMIHGIEVSGGNIAGVPMGFDLPPEAKAQQEAEAKTAAAAAEKQRLKEDKREARRAAKKARGKSDPELLAFSRELRDRWQEHVAAGGPGAMMLKDKQRGRYAVGRLLEARDDMASGQTRRVVEVVQDEGVELPKPVPKERWLEAA